jgi:hypothetical protein
VSDPTLRGRTALQGLRQSIGWQVADRSFGERLLRTAKSCGSGIRC